MVNWQRKRQKDSSGQDATVEVAIADVLPPVRTPVVVMFPKSGAPPLRTTVARHSLAPPVLILDAPLSGGDQVLVGNGEALKVQWFSSDGMHALGATFDMLGNEDGPVWHVKVGDSLEIINRRRFARARKRGTALVAAGKNEFTVNVMDVSEGGVRCRVPLGVDDTPSSSNGAGEPADAENQAVAPEDVIEQATVVTTELDLDAEGMVVLRGFVAWVGHGSSWLEFGVAFEELDTDDPRTEALRQHVLALLREHRRKELDRQSLTEHAPLEIIQR
jgi:hypothetical protein